MSVRRRGTKWMVDIEYTHPDGRRQRVRKVSPVRSLRGAEAYERQVRQELLAGTYGKKEVKEKVIPTLGAFADEFVETYAVTNNKPSEVAAKRSALRKHLVPMFGKRKLDEIKVRQVEQFKSAKLKEGLAPKTVNNFLSVLHRLLVVAREWDLISEVPAIKWLKVPTPEFDFLDFEEAERLVRGADGEWGAMITLALKTGMRMGELRALRWDDVDLVAGKLVVRKSAWKQIVGTPKNGRTRELPLSQKALQVMKAHRHMRGDQVFCNPDGSMYTKEQCKHPLWRACKRAGLRRIGWHVLRHTFASHLVMRGAPVKAVQELMGHSTMEMTMRYSHLSPDVRRDAVGLLDKPAVHVHGTIAAQEAERGG